MELNHIFIWSSSIDHNIFQRGASKSYSTVETTLVILGHNGFLSTINWSFVGRSSLYLLWPVLYNEETLRSLLKPLLKSLLTYSNNIIEGNNFVWSLLKSLLKRVTLVVGLRILWHWVVNILNLNRLRNYII
jgi:hypothetical protein